MRAHTFEASISGLRDDPDFQYDAFGIGVPTRVQRYFALLNDDSDDVWVRWWASLSFDERMRVKAERFAANTLSTYLDQQARHVLSAEPWATIADVCAQNHHGLHNILFEHSGHDIADWVNAHWLAQTPYSIPPCTNMHALVKELNRVLEHVKLSARQEHATALRALFSATHQKETGHAKSTELRRE